MDLASECICYKVGLRCIATPNSSRLPKSDSHDAVFNCDRLVEPLEPAGSRINRPRFS